MFQALELRVSVITLKKHHIILLNMIQYRKTYGELHNHGELSLGSECVY